jgi:hypothetical protein
MRTDRESRATVGYKRTAGTVTVVRTRNKRLISTLVAVASNGRVVKCDTRNAGSLIDLSEIIERHTKDRPRNDAVARQSRRLIDFEDPAPHRKPAYAVTIGDKRADASIPSRQST